MVLLSGQYMLTLDFLGFTLHVGARCLSAVNVESLQKLPVGGPKGVSTNHLGSVHAGDGQKQCKQ